MPIPDTISRLIMHEISLRRSPPFGHLIITDIKFDILGKHTRVRQV